MGEAIIARGNNSGSGGGEFGAKIVVKVSTGASVTCSNGSKTFTQTGNSEVTFTVPSFGNWTVTATYSALGMTRTKTVTVEVYQIYKISLMSGHTYGISINMGTSAPNTAVTYTDDAVGFTPLTVSSGACNYGSWSSIISDEFGCKPCLYYNNARSVYLNPSNYAVNTSGASADITSGNAGDVMVEFKRTWYKFDISGNTLTFQVADYDRSDDGFVSDAFYSMDGNGTLKDYMYYSAYEGYNISNRLRSLSGKTPTRNITIGTARAYCKTIGTTFGLEDWSKRCYILGLLMLVTKARGIQSVIGNGICDSNAAINTGTMNTRGLFYGGASNVGCKVFGIENFWGNYYKWCDGLVTTGTSGTIKMKNKAPYTDAGSDYTIVSGIMPHGGNYITQMKPFFNGAMVFPSLVQGDASIGWQDYALVGSNASCVAFVGGNYDYDAAYSGPFCVYVGSTASDSDGSVGARSVAA